MYRTRTVRELLRDQQRNFEQQLARKDEQIQSLLDRIQHPDRTPLWREPPPPLEDYDVGVTMRGGLPVYATDASELEEGQ
jgi:hypothetical protein